MTDDDARKRFLARVSAALGRDDTRTDASAPLHAPAFAPAADASGPRDTAALAKRFRDELALVSGDTVFVPDASAVDGAIAAIVEARGLRAVTGDLASDDYAIVRADALIADTGSVLVIERSAAARLAPYLPRTCIVVADAAMLHPTLSSAALAALFASARRGDKGEAVIITGPARTADIEKTLVLGAHGPRHLIVVMSGVLPSDVGDAT